MNTRANPWSGRCGGRERAFAHYRREMAGRRATSRRCFPIVQGSMFADLRRECAERLLDAGCRRVRDRRALGGGAAAAESGDGGGERTRSAARPAALCHGRGDAGGAGGVRGARHRHDGLRAALAQRPQRLAVHVRRAGWSSSTPATETTRARSTSSAVAILAETIQPGLPASSVSGGGNPVRSPRDPAQSPAVP